jgi:hypothetical protein
MLSLNSQKLVPLKTDPALGLFIPWPRLLLEARSEDLISLLQHCQIFREFETAHFFQHS